MDEKKRFTDVITDGDNSQKMALAMAMAVALMNKKFYSECDTNDKEACKKLAADLAAVYGKGIRLVVMSGVYEFLEFITKEGTEFNVPNNAEKLKTILAVNMMHIQKECKSQVVEFEKLINSHTEGCVTVMTVDKSDPIFKERPDEGEMLH